MGFTVKDWVTEEWIFGTALLSQDGNSVYLKDQLQNHHDHDGRPPISPSGIHVVPAAEDHRGAEFWGQTALEGTCGSPPCVFSSYMDAATLAETSLIIPYWSHTSNINSKRGMQGIGKKVGSGETRAYHGTLEWVSPPQNATAELSLNVAGSESAWIMNLSNLNSYVYP